MKRLILFDIAGTLISAHGAGKRSFGLGLRDVYGTAGPIETLGAVDRVLQAIVAEVAEPHPA